MRNSKTHWFAVVGVGVVAMMSMIAPVAAAEPTRDEYVATAEPICKTNVLANRRIFKGAKEQVKSGKLKLASAHFFRAATAFAKTIGQLEALPRPAEDERRLGKWFDLLRAEKEMITRIGTALAAEDRHRAGSYSVDLNRNSNLANNAVLGFGFDYCRIDPARFG